MKQTMRELLSLAVLSTPSGDNCQPFKFYWKDNTLYINHDDELAQHKLNHLNYSSLLSLGCLIENLKIMAKDYAIDINIDMDPDFPLQNIRVDFKEGLKDFSSGLSPYFSQRCTDRRLYEKGWDDKLVQKLLNISQDYPAKMEVVKVLPKKVEKHFMKVDGIFWKDSKVFFDTLKWVRFSQKEVIESKDGLPAKNLGVNFLEKACLWFASRNKFFQKIIRYSGATFVGKMLVKKQLESSGGFIFFYSKTFSPNDIVEVGQLAERMWLELTREKYAVHPITLGTLMPYLSRHVPMKKKFSPEICRLFEEGADVMESELSLPVWGFRWGKVKTPLPADAWTYRREVII